MKKIEICENNRIRVFKSSCKSRVCLGQFLSKETLRNVWLFGPVLLTNFDAIFEIPNGLKTVNITGAYYHNLLYVLFGILLLDGKKALKYDYHTKTDRFVFNLISCLFLIPLILFALLIALSCVYGLFTEFCWEFVFATVLISCFCYSVIRLIKSVHKFSNFSDNFESILLKSKVVKFFLKEKHFIKYADELL